MRALSLALLLNVALFILLGVAVGVRTNLAFPLMAALSAAPAIGLVPWLTMRLRPWPVAMILAALIVGAMKLTGCVVARFVYGPKYVELGYVAGDWRSAKLMISIFWSLTVALSTALTAAEFWRLQPRAATEPMTSE